MRIAVNQEMLNLMTFLDTCPANFMETGISKGKKKKKKSLDEEVQESMLMVITFHSLEEKLVA